MAGSWWPSSIHGGCGVDRSLVVDLMHCVWFMQRVVSEGFVPGPEDTRLRMFVCVCA